MPFRSKKAKKVKLFPTAQGYATRSSRDDWLRFHPEVNPRDVPDTYEADLDPEKPLYYWQLFSLLGEKRIVKFINSFYKRVFKDSDPKYEWFRLAFERIAPFDHHVHTQASYWADSFGGGKLYHGGDYRLNFHHHNNAGHVMNADGAERWMHHMQGALKDTEREWNKIDERIYPCVLDFLHVKMQKYAKNHKWKFNEEDFAFAKNVINIKVTTKRKPHAAKPAKNHRGKASDQLPEDERKETTVSVSGNSNQVEPTPSTSSEPTSSEKSSCSKTSDGNSSVSSLSPAPRVRDDKMPVSISESGNSDIESGSIEKMPSISEFANDVPDSAGDSSKDN